MYEVERSEGAPLKKEDIKPQGTQTGECEQTDLRKKYRNDSLAELVEGL